jgi:hypothetical protein
VVIIEHTGLSPEGDTVLARPAAVFGRPSATHALQSIADS